MSHVFLAVICRSRTPIFIIEAVFVTFTTVEGRAFLEEWRATAARAKIFQILAVVLGTEIDWHTHSVSSDVKVDVCSKSSAEHVATLDQPNRSCVG
jgi:hypothetical protein